jgi:hypothetical protein
VLTWRSTISSGSTTRLGPLPQLPRQPPAVISTPLRPRSWPKRRTWIGPAENEDVGWESEGQGERRLCGGSRRYSQTHAQAMAIPIASVAQSAELRLWRGYLTCSAPCFLQTLLVHTRTSRTSGCAVEEAPKSCAAAVRPRMELAKAMQQRAWSVTHANRSSSQCTNAHKECLSATHVRNGQPRSPAGSKGCG